MLVSIACSEGVGEPATTVPPATTAAAPTSSSTLTPSSPPTSAPATTSTTALPRLQGLAYETVDVGLPSPVLVTAPPGDERLFVVTKDGRIWVYHDDLRREEPFLDLRSLVRNRGEQGLLGLAFAPDYADSGRFYVHYNDGRGATVLARYQVSADPDRADPDSAQVLLTIDQPAGNHNGGMVAFGPDGYLYLGLGDGGGANDVFGQGQRPDTLLAALLRLDVSGADGYTIPPDNPFRDGGGAAEVWAIGLRNPWRFWFDEGLIYIGDVGQGAFEEINVVQAGTGGLNYGWPLTEGLHCFRPSSGCDTAGTTPPVVEVAHGDGGTCSITGGVVYRGEAIPEVAGHYFFSDYCGGYLRSFRADDGGVEEQADWTEQVGSAGRVTSFGVDAAGEVYLTSADGTVRRLIPIR